MSQHETVLSILADLLDDPTGEMRDAWVVKLKQVQNHVQRLTLVTQCTDVELQEKFGKLSHVLEMTAGEYQGTGTGRDAAEMGEFADALRNLVVSGKDVPEEVVQGIDKEDLIALAQRLDDESSWVGDNDTARAAMSEAAEVIRTLADIPDEPDMGVLYDPANFVEQPAIWAGNSLKDQSPTQPVGMLKWTLEVLQGIVGDNKYDAVARFDLVRLIERLTETVGQHVAEPVYQHLEGGVRKVSRIEHTLERLEAMLQTPTALTESECRDVNDAMMFLQVIHRNTRGHANLGKEGYVVVADSSRNMSEDTLDSVRDYLTAYGEGRHSAEELRLQASFSGRYGLLLMPKWFAETWGHMSKGGFANLIYQTLIEGQLTSLEGEDRVYFGGGVLTDLERRIKAGEKTALSDYVADKLKGGKDE